MGEREASIKVQGKDKNGGRNKKTEKRKANKTNIRLCGVSGMPGDSSDDVAERRTIIGTDKGLS